MQVMDEKSKGILATVVAALLWSTGGLFIKLLPQDAMTILFYRSLYAAILFGIVYRRELLHMNRQMWLNSFFYAFLLITFVVSTKLTTAANAIFLQYTGTAYILLLEPWLLKTERKLVDIVTTIVCFAGMGLFFLDDFDASGGMGMALAAISGLLLAALFLGQRLNAPRYHVASIFWGNLWVMLAGLPFWWASPPATGEEHLMLGFLGFVQIGMGYLLFTYGLQRILAVESVLISMLEPVLNPVWVIIGYGEWPAPMAIAGGLIVLIALAARILILEYQRRQEKSQLVENS